MRPSVRTVWAMAALFAIGALTAPAARATSEYEKPGEIGVLAGVGLGDSTLVGNDNDTHVNPLVGARFGWHFKPFIAGFIDGTWVPYKGDASIVGNADEYAVRLGPEFYVNPASKWQFFINAGLGYMKIAPDTGPDDGRGFGSLGLGVRRGYNPGALRLELRGDHTVSDSNIAGGSDFTQLKAVAGWTWGIGAKPKDTDGDGVYDKKDKCPDTPHGCKVDADGCPLDGDKDGVCDGLDQCPDTPAGWPVDAKGCNLDSDGDGVPDGADKCPNTVKGCKVDAAGCPADADADGVCDGLDQCPNTLKGCRVDGKGCPVDSDADGVCDGLDQCPGTPAGAKVDAKGCEPPKPVFFTPEQKEFILEGVKFANNSAKLDPGSTIILDRIADALKSYPDTKIEIGGHTDSTGSDAYNMKLSNARAKAVHDYLVSKGANPANLTFHGYGETKPIADNKTADGRAKNRRVELHKAE